MPIVPFAGPSTAKGALVPLGSTVVTNTTTAEIAFSNIPALYTDLYLQATVRATESTVSRTIYITPFYSGLPAQPQSNTMMDQTGVTTLTASRTSNQDGQFSGLAPSAGADPDAFGTFEWWCLNYANTTNFKPSLSRWYWTSPANGQQGWRAGLTRANGAITTVSVSTFSGSVFLVPGSRATLFGVRTVGQ